MKIKVEKSGNYIEWCDERWYNTTRDVERAGEFSESEAEIIRQQMLDHYVYCLIYIHDDGSEELVHYKSKGHAITENIDDYIKAHPLNGGEVRERTAFAHTTIPESKCSLGGDDSEVLWD